MIEQISQIILFGSLVGMGTIAARKIPTLLSLPEVENKGSKESLFLKLKQRLEKINPLKNFSREIFLQRLLARFRILILKTENLTSNWSKQMKEKALEKKIKENDNYWEEVKKIKNEPFDKTGSLG